MLSLCAFRFVKKIVCSMSTLFFYLIYFSIFCYTIYLVAHNVTDENPVSSSGEARAQNTGAAKYRYINIYNSPSTLFRILTLSIIHGCLTDLVSDKLLYLFFNDFKSHGHIYRLLKMTLLELRVWRVTVLSEGKTGKTH